MKLNVFSATPTANVTKTPKTFTPTAGDKISEPLKLIFVILFFLLAPILGLVTKCTLTGIVKNIDVDGRSYCVVDKGRLVHPLAVDTCKQLNARLPLPRNQLELDEFQKISGGLWTHVDARNPRSTSHKALWEDAEGKPLGSRPVYLGVKKL